MNKRHIEEFLGCLRTCEDLTLKQLRNHRTIRIHHSMYIISIPRSESLQSDGFPRETWLNEITLPLHFEPE